MPRSFEWQTRMKAVEREYVAMHQAADHFKRAASRDPSILQEGLRLREIVDALDRLEATYMIRLFAEFESGARQYWASTRDTHPRTADLLDALAARRRIPDTQRQNAHVVREYRNKLVHEREAEKKEESGVIKTARGYLCHFFSFLPAEW